MYPAWASDVLGMFVLVEVGNCALDQAQPRIGWSASMARRQRVRKWLRGPWEYFKRVMCTRPSDVVWVIAHCHPMVTPPVICMLVESRWEEGYPTMSFLHEVAHARMTLISSRLPNHGEEWRVEFARLLRRFGYLVPEGVAIDAGLTDRMGLSVHLDIARLWRRRWVGEEIRVA